MKKNLVSELAVLRLTVSGMLIAVGIVIPMFSPVKVLLEPASFTLASHVAIFIAMFISPVTAVTVAAGTALGFFLGAFPLVIGLRAATHIIFAWLGAYYLRKSPEIIASALKLRMFSFVIGIIHAAAEVAVVSLLYFNGGMGEAWSERGFVAGVLLLVGVGTVIHSMVDFEIAQIIRLPIQKSGYSGELFVNPTSEKR